MTFKPGTSGNPHGNRHHTRHLLNQKFLQALLLDFEAHGRKAIEECRKQSPLGYVKVLGHLAPREMQVEYSGGVKGMTDEQIERGIELIKGRFINNEEWIEFIIATVVLWLLMMTAIYELDLRSASRPVLFGCSFRLMSERSLDG